MKKSELKKIIKETILKEMVEENKLKLGKKYSIFDPGMNRFVDGYEYVGKNLNSKSPVWVFRLADGPGDSFHMIDVSKDELEDINEIGEKSINESKKKLVKESLSSFLEKGNKMNKSFSQHLDKYITNYKNKGNVKP